MATLDTIRPIAAPAGFRTSFTTLVGLIATWNDRRQTRKALEKLTARELNDIGLIPGDIDAM